MKCIALTHVAFEDLGLWEPEIRAHGYEVQYLQAGVDSVEPLYAADLVVVLGGPIGVADMERFPYLEETLRMLRDRLATGLPTIGVCLGAQLLAAAAGARVTKGTTEIGWAPVDLTPEGLAGPLRHLDGVPVLHWHGDTFDLPSGAQLLASTSATPHQAFALGNALGVQFHPEVDAQEIEPWLIGHVGELDHHGIDVGELRAASRDANDAAATAGIGLIREYVRSLGGAATDSSTRA